MAPKPRRSRPGFLSGRAMDQWTVDERVAYLEAARAARGDAAPSTVSAVVAAPAPLPTVPSAAPVRPAAVQPPHRGATATSRADEPLVKNARRGDLTKAVSALHAGYRRLGSTTP